MSLNKHNNNSDVISYAAFVGSSVLFLAHRSIFVRRLSTTSTSAKAARSSLVSSSPPSKPKPVRRVAVLGAGIGGLSMAHALISPTTSPASSSLSTDKEQQDDPTPIEVSVFEGRPTLEPNVGAGFVLNGGLATLGKINPECQRAMIDAGNTIEGMEGRCKPWISNSSSNQGYYKLFDIPLRKLIKEAGKETEAALLPNNELMFTFIMRGACQEVLYNKLPNDAKERVYFGKTLIGIEPAEAADYAGSDGGVMCKFSDGTEDGPFDLVVGSDGIRSSVREYVETGIISKDPNQRKGGFYTGLRISYAVEDAKENDLKEEEPAVATVNLGDGAFCLTPVFGTGKDRPNAKCVFSVYTDEDYIGPLRIRNRAKPIGANTGKSTEEWRQMMIQQLRDYRVPDKEPGKVISKANRFFELGVYFHNPFSSWSKQVPGSDGSHVVLIGDAAHAMPPFLGQGANQTVQDAYSLSKLVKEYNKQVAEYDDEVSSGSSYDYANLGLMLKEHERLRKAVVSTIVYRTLLLGYLNLGGPFGIYSKFRDIIFRTMGLFQNVVMSAAMPKV